MIALLSTVHCIVVHLEPSEAMQQETHPSWKQTPGQRKLRVREIRSIRGFSKKKIW